VGNFVSPGLIPEYKIYGSFVVQDQVGETVLTEGGEAKRSQQNTYHHCLCKERVLCVHG
jgi:hypothetical protein